MDRLCQIQAGKKNIGLHDNSSTIRKKILTNVRSHCLEKLTQEMIRVALPMDDTIKVDAEVQEMVHAQCAKALNVPEQGMNAEHVDILNDKFDLVYKTNALSSIMNIPAIAQEATEYIRLGKINKEVLEKEFSDEIKYSLCCKILDRSARDKLKKDKRSFNKRFKEFMKFVNSENFDDADSKKVLNDWVYNKRSKKFIYDILGELDAILYDYPFVGELLPEAFLDYNEIFGRLIFIKYLVDQKTITLKN